MKIYNTDQFEKLKINPVSLNDFDKIDFDFSILHNAVTDIDGNHYDAVKINGKTWMASNLRTTKFNDGSEIARFNDIHQKDSNLPYYAYPGVSMNSIENFGLYYNFEAVNTNKLAPKGWHVPTIEEYQELLDYIVLDDKCNLTPEDKNNSSAHIAKSLCSQEEWIANLKKNAVGNEQHLNNSSKLNIYPSGYWYPNNGTSNDVCTSVYIWTCSINSNDIYYAWCINTSGEQAYIEQNDVGRYYGFAVRCVKD